ncbi:MAG TPA: prolipoprotein diacylglyceryl transferase [Candidatus Nanoarchaeia archaeon]|nr:prolipoprotein diacylglyceryl transferase [Candidatus Nanoarchaeia archaeon]
MFYHNINPVLLQIGPLQVRYYGLFYALGFVITYFMVYYLAKRKQIKFSKDDAADLIIYLLFGIVIGSRIVYVVFYNPVYYMSNFLEIFALWHGGLSFHGGLIGGITATYLFSKKKKMHFYDLADLIVMPAALALALGRIGNFINAELYGRITNVSWCIDYSKNKYMSEIPEGCRHPSQIYESLKNIFIFITLWFIKDKKLPRGFLFWAFVAMYGLLRTALEFFRQPDEQLGFIFGNLSMGQLLSFPLFLIGAYMMIKLKRKKD